MASDNFNRADGSLGPNWTLGFGGSLSPLQIVSNQVEPSATNINTDSWWNARSWPDDQQSQITVKALANGSYIGVVLRYQPAAQTTYRLYLGPGAADGSSITAGIQKRVASSDTLLASTTTTLAPGDVLLGRVQGSLLSFYKNGSLLVQVNDSAIPSGGAPGILCAGITAVTDAIVDDWVGSSISNVIIGPFPTFRPDLL